MSKSYNGDHVKHQRQTHKYTKVCHSSVMALAFSIPESWEKKKTLSNRTFLSCSEFPWQSSNSNSQRFVSGVSGQNLKSGHILYIIRQLRWIKPHNPPTFSMKWSQTTWWQRIVSNQIYCSLIWWRDLWIIFSCGICIVIQLFKVV